MARVLFQCQITDDDVLAIWRKYLRDPHALLPASVEEIPASFVAAAMEDAALTMVQVLLIDRTRG
jgi:hypothetical protein